MVLFGRSLFWGLCLSFSVLGMRGLDSLRVDVSNTRRMCRGRVFGCPITTSFLSLFSPPYPMSSLAIYVDNTRVVSPESLQHLSFHGKDVLTDPLSSRCQGVRSCNQYLSSGFPAAIEQSNVYLEIGTYVFFSFPGRKKRLVVMFCLDIVASPRVFSVSGRSTSHGYITVINV